MTVTSLDDFKRSKGMDDAAFVECPECGAGEFTVVVRFADGRPFIAHLVCVSQKCNGDRETMVVGGFLE